MKKWKIYITLEVCKLYNLNDVKLLKVSKEYIVYRELKYVEKIIEK